MFCGFFSLMYSGVFHRSSIVVLEKKNSSFVWTEKDAFSNLLALVLKKSFSVFMYVHLFLHSGFLVTAFASV